MGNAKIVAVAAVLLAVLLTACTQAPAAPTTPEQPAAPSAPTTLPEQPAPTPSEPAVQPQAPPPEPAAPPMVDNTSNASNETVPALPANGVSVNILSPADGSTVSGTVPISFSTSDAAIDTYIYIDNSTFATQRNIQPHPAHWDSKGVADGKHVLTITVDDGMGDNATTSVSVNVLNNAMMNESNASNTSMAQ